MYFYYVEHLSYYEVHASRHATRGAARNMQISEHFLLFLHVVRIVIIHIYNFVVKALY